MPYIKILCGWGNIWLWIEMRIRYGYVGDYIINYYIIITKASKYKGKWQEE